MNPLRLDWKFLVTFTVTVLGVTVSFWQPYFQTPEKDLTVRLISQSSLEPIASTAKPLGLEITIDKTPVQSPYLSVLEITNTGSKPIRSDDFEGPLVIYTNEDRTILRAQVTNTIPKNLRPTSEIAGNEIRLNPLLLNAGDSIVLTVLSAGGASDFDASARIAGIERVKLITAPTSSTSKTEIFLIILLALLASVSSNALIWRYETTKSGSISLNSRTVLITANVLLYITGITTFILYNKLGYESIWGFFGAFTVFIVLTFPIAIWIEKRPKNEAAEKHE